MAFALDRWRSALIIRANNLVFLLEDALCLMD